MRLKYPPLPTEWPGLGGPIRVRRAKELVDTAGEENLGLWDSETRTLSVLSSLRGPNAWRYFWHEECHSWLDDLGVSEHMSEELQENICVGYATYRMHLMGIELKRVQDEQQGTAVLQS